MKFYETLTLLLQFLFFVAGVLTVVIYHRQLVAMQGQLSAFLATASRTLHFDLLRLALSDPALLEVWLAEASPDSDANAAKRHIFVNLHLSNIANLFAMDRLTKAQVVEELDHHFSNRYYQDFWIRSREHRRAMCVLPSDRLFHELCETTYLKHCGHSNSPAPVSSTGAA